MTKSHSATFSHGGHEITLEMSLEAMEKLTNLAGMDGYHYLNLAANSPLKLVKMFDAFQIGSSYSQNEIFDMFFKNTAESNSEEFVTKLAHCLATITGQQIQEKIDSKETPIKKKRTKVAS